VRLQSAVGHLRPDAALCAPYEWILTGRSCRSIRGAGHLVPFSPRPTGWGAWLQARLRREDGPRRRFLGVDLAASTRWSLGLLGHSTAARRGARADSMSRGGDGRLRDRQTIRGMTSSYQTLTAPIRTSLLRPVGLAIVGGSKASKLHSPTIDGGERQCRPGASDRE